MPPGFDSEDREPARPDPIAKDLDELEAHLLESRTKFESGLEGDHDWDTKSAITSVNIHLPGNVVGEERSPSSRPSERVPAALRPVLTMFPRRMRPYVLLLLIVMAWWTYVHRPDLVEPLKGMLGVGS